MGTGTKRLQYRETDIKPFHVALYGQLTLYEELDLKTKEQTHLLMNSNFPAFALLLSFHFPGSSKQKWNGHQHHGMCLVQQKRTLI